MLAPPLDVVATLDVIEAAVLAPVRAGKCPPNIVKLQSKRIAAAFGEDFKHVLFRMITPNGLAQEIGCLRLLFDFDLDLRGTGAALGAVNPAVRSPFEIAGHGVRVFEAEAGEMHDGVGIRY